MAKNIEVDNSSSLEKITRISSGTEIKGDLKSDSDIRIDGTLVGNLKTNGKVVMGTTGTVRGEITCKNSDVQGKIEGKITAQELLSLKANSIINGDIIAKRLAIEPGAKFTGNCNMSNTDGMVATGTSKVEELKKVK